MRTPERSVNTGKEGELRKGEENTEKEAGTLDRRKNTGKEGEHWKGREVNTRKGALVGTELPSPVQVQLQLNIGDCNCISARVWIRHQVLSEIHMENTENIPTPAWIFQVSYELSDCSREILKEVIIEKLWDTKNSSLVISHVNF